MRPRPPPSSHLGLSRRLTPSDPSLAAQKKNPRPSVLWAYKKDLGFTSNRKKRETKVKREVKRGQREVGEMDPFELFVSVTDVRYTCVLVLSLFSSPCRR